MKGLTAENAENAEMIKWHILLCDLRALCGELL